MMRATTRLAMSLLVLGLSASSARASDPVGVYALIDKVVLEPNAEAPERIQIWGAFSVAIANDVNYYHPVARGYMYFSAPKDKEEIARKEWADLKKAAGSRQVIAFGKRWDLKASVRKADEKPKSPDVYPLSSGLSRIRTDTDYAPIRALLDQSK
ncbi:MAG TPA: hypothetical protein VGK99_09045 [Acidobacteriota bacterium]